MEGTIRNDTEEGGEAVNLTLDGFSAADGGEIRAVTIISHHQRGAWLELPADCLIDRDRLPTRPHPLTGCILEGYGNNRRTVRPGCKGVRGNCQFTAQQIRKLHAVLKAHRRRADLRRIRVETKEGIDRGNPFDIAGEIGNISAVKRTALHRPCLGVERLLDGLKIKQAEIGTNE